MDIVSIIVADEKLKCYNRFDNIDTHREMEIRGNVIRYNDKHEIRYVVRWGDDESYLKTKGYVLDPNVYVKMVNEYNAHLTASEVPMQK